MGSVPVPRQVSGADEVFDEEWKNARRKTRAVGVPFALRLEQALGQHPPLLRGHEPLQVLDRVVITFVPAVLTRVTRPRARDIGQIDENVEVIFIGHGSRHVGAFGLLRKKLSEVPA